MKKPSFSFRRVLFVLAFCLAHGLGAPHGFEKQVQELNDAEPAAVVNGRTYLVGELKNLIALRATPTGEGYIIFTMKDLLEVGRLDPAYSRLAEQARAEGISLSEEDVTEVERFLRSYVERQLFAEHIAAARKEPDEETILAAYESQKDQRFFLPERMVIRQLYFPASSSGSGEAEAEEAWKRLEAGDDFSVLQSEYPLDQSRVALTEIVELARVEQQNPEMHAILRGLEDGKYSRPFRRGEGYMIVQRQFLIPRAYMPLESVRPVLYDEWTNAQDMKAISAFFKRTASDSRLLRIHPQNLANAGPLAFDSDVLLSVADRNFTRGELRDLVGWQLAPDVPHDERTFAELAVMTAPVQRALLDHLIFSRSLMDAAEVKAARKAAEDTALVRRLLDRRFAAAPPEVSEDEIAALARYRKLELSPEVTDQLRQDLLAQKRIEFEIETMRTASEDTEFTLLLSLTPTN